MTYEVFSNRESEIQAIMAQRIKQQKELLISGDEATAEIASQLLGEYSEDESLLRKFAEGQYKSITISRCKKDLPTSRNEETALNRTLSLVEEKEEVLEFLRQSGVIKGTKNF